jgi:hypothetical protein
MIDYALAENTGWQALVSLQRTLAKTVTSSSRARVTLHPAAGIASMPAELKCYG